MLRSGSDYLAGLSDGRHVYVDGKLVEDVPSHPSFSGPARVIAGIYDRVRGADASAGLTFEENGERFSNAWLMPHSAEGVAARRRLHIAWAEGSYGLMGRAPDHVSSMLVGFAGAAESLFARGGQQFADNLCRFYERARREDLYLAYAIVPPQIDRTQSAAGQPEPFMYPGVVTEKDGGIVVRGAQMIGTSAIIADWILITYIVPLKQGDEDYAISFVAPINAPGMKLYPRRPYASIASSVYDYPLSSRYDETDSMVVMDDVFVPWEHVFIYKRVDICNAQFNDTGAHLLGNYQAQVRLVVKLQFLAGLAQRLMEIGNLATIPDIMSTLGGDVAAFTAAIEAMTHAAQMNPEERGGLSVPRAQYVYACMSLARRWIPEILRQLRELSGGAFICVPSSQEVFESPDTAADARRYYQSAATPADERVRFLKLMWDIVGTEFAGRQLQYEMFYSSHQAVVNMRLYRNFDWAWGRRLVDDCLAQYSVPDKPLERT
jgi:4-hydroxyphenylacetate 3-monooxygenase